MGPSTFGGDVGWTTQDFIVAYNEISESGMPNFAGCKILVPTSIRYDRMEEALGDAVSLKEKRVLSLLKYGMPIDCKAEYGVKRQQKNHFSDMGFQKEVWEFLQKGLQNLMYIRLIS